MYKILVSCGKRTKEHTYSGVISGEISGKHTISGKITGDISGTISGYIHSINFITENLKTYSGVASGMITDSISGTISGIISDTVVQKGTISGIIKDTVEYEVPGYSFLLDVDGERDWQTSSEGEVKLKIIELYKLYPETMFIPVHVLNRDLSVEIDHC